LQKSLSGYIFFWEYRQKSIFIMSVFFQLVRWRNLAIVFLTQFIIWYCVVLPVQTTGAGGIFLQPDTFLLLTFSTICIAAAGYIINDYFDVEIDAVNKPDKMIIGRLISRRTAILWHSALNIAGVIAAVILCRRIGHYYPLALQLGCSILLWLYSTRYKRRFMEGNIVVSLLTALTIIALVLYEPALYAYAGFDFFIDTAQSIFPNPFWVIMTYAYFAFMLNWIREIVKDMEDFRGDAAQGCDTMPIRWGLHRSARFVMLLGIITLIPLVLAAYTLLHSTKMYFGIYIIAALIFPLMAVLFYLPRHTHTRHYAWISRWLKIIMLLGIVALLVYHF